MLNYYRTVADRSPLPVVIYNFPQCTGYDLPVELVAELAEHRNIIGIKESSGDVAKVAEVVKRTAHVRREARVTHEFQPVTGRMVARATAAPVGDFVSAGALAGTARPSSAAVEVIGSLRTRQKAVGFQTLVGSAQKLLPLLQAGACGGILAFAACAPTACYEIYAAWKDDDQPLAAEKQQRIARAAQRIVGELGVSGVKYACDLNGFAGGSPRLPLLPLTAEQRGEVEMLLEEIKS
jgi:dihydrodipicolinate synthase/N-acetylneuraminate lyase